MIILLNRIMDSKVKCYYVKPEDEHLKYCRLKWGLMIPTGLRILLLSMVKPEKQCWVMKVMKHMVDHSLQYKPPWQLWYFKFY
jgi:hypothetical protein